MRIDTLYLEGFRNYDRQELELDGGCNVIYGENAQGKTTILEAVYLLTGGKSFRTNYDRELIAFGEDAAAVRGA